VTSAWVTEKSSPGVTNAGVTNSGMPYDLRTWTTMPGVRRWPVWVLPN